MRRSVVLMPLVGGVLLAAGVFIGVQLSSGGYNASGGPMDKVRAVLGFIDAHYVDSVDTDRLADKTVEALLQQLDPHSGYMSAEDRKALDEPLEGKFEGIGIEYNILRDSLTVIAVVPGGPSEKAGLKAGDRLVRANGVSLTGAGSEEKNIKSQLRGKAGSVVKIELLRRGTAPLISLTVTRGSIPIRSVDGVYMMNSEIGYMRLARFAETSHDEFVAAANELRAKGMKKLILDLRGNGGGYLHTAVAICDEFLPAGKMIVYTQGRAEGRVDYKATAAGNFENIPLAIVIDQYSASASEVLAGAIQDNDRGIVVGRRSFGKGLVQQEQTLRDGSGFRLTIARYYTPTGRCIQKPYRYGEEEAYREEDDNRYTSGELLNADSIHFADSLKFRTPGGKIVYGGGGIMPDVFVPVDTANRSAWFNRLLVNNAFALFGLEYAQQHKAELTKTGREAFLTNFTVTPDIIASLVRTAGTERNPEQEKRTAAQVQRYVKSYIARSVWGDDGFFPAWNATDPMLLAAVKALN